MKKKTKSLETFLIQVEYAIDLRGDVQQVKLNELIEKWRIIIPSFHPDFAKNPLKIFRNLHHLKLRIQWIEKTVNYKKKTTDNLTVFFCHIYDYIDIEIKFIRLKQMNSPSGLSESKESKESKMKWTESKRSLVELIYALKQVGCINGGKTSLRELIDCFSYLFDTDLSNFHSTAKRLTQRNLNKYQSRSFFWMI